MKVILTHKIALNPTKEQKQLFLQAIGTARFTYNWALAEWKKQYEAGLKPNKFSLSRDLNSIKKEQFPWMYDVPKDIVHQAIFNLGNAFSNFFTKRAGYPKFKKKGRNESACLAEDPNSLKLEGKKIRLPKLGWIKTYEELRFKGKPLNATVSLKAGKWYVAVPVEMEIEPSVRENQAAVGVDFGLSKFATLSTGEQIENPKILKASLKKLARLNRSLARKKKGSANWYKAKLKLAKFHTYLANCRNDFLHKFSRDLVNRFSSIGLEDLNVKGMVRNRKLSRSIIDASWSEARRQIEYKAALYSSSVQIFDRWYASSKICSKCGYKLKELRLNVRFWTCPGCGAEHQRDENAAKNLTPTVNSTESYVCGENCSGFISERKQTSKTKQPRRSRNYSEVPNGIRG